MQKKREILPLVNNATVALSNMTGSAAKLEYHDNDKVSRMLKKSIVDFENTELKALKDAVKDIREEINCKPKKKLVNRSVNISNLKQSKK